MSKPCQIHHQRQNRSQHDIDGIVIPLNDGGYRNPEGDDQEKAPRRWDLVQQEEGYRQRGGDVRTGKGNRMDASVLLNP